MIETLEKKLDSFDPDQRKQALTELCRKVQAGQIPLAETTTDVNLHCHTFFSYNSYGYSPSKFAWLAKKTGLAVAGVVDFDVLDAIDEFFDAADMLDLKAVAGMETRVFIPEFAEKVINSPGEPGIAYHMAVGFASSELKAEQKNFLLNLKKTAQRRNMSLTQRVNKYLSPVELDFEKDVLTLTPAGNPTERHICSAYAKKAKELFPDNNALAKFWSEKLDTADVFELPESRELLNTLRAKTMKRGGVGYVTSDKKSFPTMADTNKFALAAGAIPTITWLDGTSDCEKEVEKLFAVAMSTGSAALNIIPDRNYTPGVMDEKLKNLYDVVELAQRLNLPVVVGTEMNSPSQKFKDAFETKELSPLVPIFLEGSHIVYAHSVLQGRSSMGYLSQWAENNFKTVADKNKFYNKLGSSLMPSQHHLLTDLTENITAQQILDKISN